MVPSRTFRYTLKEGTQGHEVWALQLCLNEWSRSNGVQPVESTGLFGSQTLHLVRVYQRRNLLVVDGIAGPTTQRYLALDLLRPAQTKYAVPSGLIRGMVEGETGWAVGAVNWNSPGGVDCGWAQQRVYEPYVDDSKFVNAFNGAIAFEELGRRLRQQRDRYYGKAGAKTNQRAWELAVLFWNWQSAAERYAVGLTDWSYWDHWIENGIERKELILMSQPAHWVKAIGVKGVETGHQWASHYINSKTSYVTDWS